MEKLGDNRHGLSTTKSNSRQQGTNDNHRQRHLTIYNQRSTPDTRQQTITTEARTDTTDNQHQHPITNLTADKRYKTEKMQLTRSGCKQKPFSWVPIHPPSDRSSKKCRCLMCSKPKNDNDRPTTLLYFCHQQRIIAPYKLELNIEKPTRPLLS
jgi:hypothetical protein